MPAESTALSFETRSLPGLCCGGHGERAAHTVAVGAANNAGSKIVSLATMSAE